MNSRKLAARALTFFPAVVIAVAAIVEVRGHAALARARHSPHALTFLVERPANGRPSARPVAAGRVGAPARARL